MQNQASMTHHESPDKVWLTALKREIMKVLLETIFIYVLLFSAAALTAGLIALLLGACKG